MNDTPTRDLTEREGSLCPCKSGTAYWSCCQPYHLGKAKPATAEQLMRSRYSAYFFRRVEYLVETTHPDTREPGLERELRSGMEGVKWSFLTIVATAGGGPEDKTGKVEFVAEFFQNGHPFSMSERSRFKRFKGTWKYLDGKG